MNNNISQNTDKSNSNAKTFEKNRNKKNSPTVCIEIARYSDVDVYECFIKGVENQIVMRRVRDDWINITQIFKIANYSKAKRTKILETESINFTFFEKIQGGYGKFQGTWIPLNDARLIVYKYRIDNVVVNKVLSFILDPQNPPFKRLKTTMKRTNSTNGTNASNTNSNSNGKLLSKRSSRRIVNNNLLTEKLDSSSTYLRENKNTKINDNIPNSQYSVSPFNKKEEAKNCKEIISNADRKFNITKIQKGKVNEDTHREDTNKEDNNGYPNNFINAVDETTNLQEINAYKSNLLYLLSIENFHDFQFQERLNKVLPLPKGLDINFIIDNQNHTALHWAASMGNSPLVEILLFKLSANPLVTNIMGFNCITKSIFYHNCYNLKTFNQILNMLKICLITADNNGRLPLHYLVELTVNKFKDQKIINFYMDSILTFLGNQGKELLFKCLNFSDISGNTVLHLAALNSNWALCDKFFNLGAAINLNNLNNETPMMIMSRNKNSNIKGTFLFNNTLHLMDNLSNVYNSGVTDNSTTLNGNARHRNISNFEVNGGHSNKTRSFNFEDSGDNNNNATVSGQPSEQLSNSNVSSAKKNEKALIIRRCVPQIYGMHNKSFINDNVGALNNKHGHMPSYSLQSTLELDLTNSDAVNLTNDKYSFGNDDSFNDYHRGQNSSDHELSKQNLSSHLHDQSNLCTILEDITVFDIFDSSVVIKDQPNTTMDYLQQSPIIGNKRRKISANFDDHDKSDNKSVLNFLRTPKNDKMDISRNNSMINLDSLSKLSHGTPILIQELNHRAVIKKLDIAESIKQFKELSKEMTDLMEHNIRTLRFEEKKVIQKIDICQLEKETLISRYNTLVNLFIVQHNVKEFPNDNSDAKNPSNDEDFDNGDDNDNGKVNRDLKPLEEKISRQNALLNDTKMKFIQHMERNQALKLATLVQEEETNIKPDLPGNGNEARKEEHRAAKNATKINDERVSDHEEVSNKTDIEMTNVIEDEMERRNDETTPIKTFRTESLTDNAKAVELAVRLTLLQFKRRLQIQNICGIKCNETITDKIVKYKKLIGNKIHDIERTLEEIENDLNRNNRINSK